MAFALLHLNVLPAAAECAIHDAQPGAPVEQLAAEHHGMDHGEAQGEQLPCEIPSQAPCCQALAACSMMLALSDAAVSMTARAPHLTIASAPLQRPLARSVAPEPPPPRG